MKHTRLLEIIREEIAGALREGEAEERAAKAAEIKAIDAKQKALDAEKRDTMKSGALEEDTLNEMAYDITIKNSEKLAKLKDEIKDSPKEGKKLLYKVIDIIQRDKKENKPIRQRDIANELEIIQQKVNPFVNLLIDLEILEKGESVTGVTKKKVTDKAQGRPAGEPKAEKPASTGKKGSPAGEPKTEKSATLTKGDDGFDKVEVTPALVFFEDLDNPGMPVFEGDKEDAEVINQADGLIFQVEKTMKDMEDKLSEEEKTEVTTAIDELKSAHSTKNVDDIKTKMDNVNVVFQKISEKLYSQQSPENQTEDVNVSDVDFEEVKG